MNQYTTVRQVESAAIPGVKFYLYKMTEGRRLTLRAAISAPNRRIREILRDQAAIEKVPEEDRDVAKWLETQDEFEQIMLEKINPAWLQWGLKQIEGLSVDGKPLGKEDWADWPSVVFDEVVKAIKEEAELNGSERKNFELPTTSGEVAAGSPSPSTVESVKSEDIGVIEIAEPIFQNT